MANEEVQILTREEIEFRLAELPGWIYDDHKLIKTFEFSNFTEAVMFLNGLAPYCDSMDHHPDVAINFKKLTFYLTDHSTGEKVTDKDFDIANKIEQLFALYES